jgi:fructose-1,6-bisphosphatase II / sedoheptulose-1,7-bisphosphatase
VTLAPKTEGAHVPRRPPGDPYVLERFLALDLTRATERAAAAAARWRGRGDELAADRAAAEAMRGELTRLPMQARVVIGEDAHADALYVGEEIGAGGPLPLDLAVAPLEGATLCAKDMPGAIVIVAIAKAGAFLRAPRVYMDKIAIGPGFAPGVVDLDREPAENIAALARAKGVKSSEITVCILDRPRHADLIAECRRTGACVRLIADGDVAGVILATQPAQTGVDMYLGRGGAPQGVLAAGALRCVGGQMQGRLALDNKEKLARAAAAGILEPGKKYTVEELSSGDVILSATGVTDGPLLSGVVFGKEATTTETVVYHSFTGTVRRIRAEHHAENMRDGLSDAERD